MGADTHGESNLPEENKPRAEEKQPLLTEEETDEIIGLACKYNSIEFNALKVVEEATEVNELLIKGLTKIQSLKPSAEEEIEEIGDLIMRLAIYIAHRGIEDDVITRISDKFRMVKGGMERYEYGTTVTVTKLRDKTKQL